MFANFALNILAAGGMTLLLALGGLLIASVLGILLAYGKLSHSRLLRGSVNACTFVLRAIPDLVLLLLAFYALPSTIRQIGAALGYKIRPEFDPFWAGMITLGIIFSAYMSETFKSGLQNIPRGQIEAAQSMGMHPWRIFRRITLPHLARLALPSFTNNWLILVKGTAVVSLIGLQDVMFRAKGAAEATAQPFTYYLLAGGFYLAVTLISTAGLLWLGHRLERRNIAGRT